MRYGVGMAVVGVMAVIAVGGVTAGIAVGTVGDGKPEKRTFRAPAGDRPLALDVRGSRLELVPAADGADGVEVTRWFKATRVAGKAETAWSQAKEGDIRLHTKCAGFMVRCEGRYRVAVPDGASVRVRGDSGKVTARELGALDVETGNGAVEVERASGPVKVRTDNGRVDVDGTEGAVDLGTSNGSIKTRKVDGAMRLETDNGRVEVRDTESERIRARADNGTVDLALKGTPRLVDARTDNGNISIALPTGGGAEYDVSTETDNGGVDVSVPERSASPHRVSAETDNGRITVKPLR